MTGQMANGSDGFWDAPKRSRCDGGCVLAIVGSRHMRGDPTAEGLIRDAFDRHRPRWFVSGGEPTGIDTMAEEEADRRGLAHAKTIHLPEQKGWEWYKKRDLLIAQQAECLVRIFSGTAPSYGSGWTANQAEKLGALVERYKVGDGPAPY